MSTSTYAFSNTAPQATDQLASLAAVLDPLTTARLGDLGLEPGARCLELGAGNGSIARWLAGQVGPSGQVVATDIDPVRLEAADGVAVHQHDLASMTLPVPGPYHLIHARLLLLHLPRRDEILRLLVDALAPGGWLVLEEFSDRPLTVLNAPPGAPDLFRRVVEALLADLADHGADMTWAWRTHAAMMAAGLEAVDTVEHGDSWAGGSHGCRLHEVNSDQKQEALLARGLTIDELDSFRALTRDPAFVAMSYQLVSTRGRRPGFS